MLKGDDEKYNEMDWYLAPLAAWRYNVGAVCPICYKPADPPVLERWYDDDDDGEGNTTKWDIRLMHICECGQKFASWDETGRLRDDVDG